MVGGRFDHLVEIRGGLMVCSQPAAGLGVRDDIYLYDNRVDAMWCAHVLRIMLPLDHVVLIAERQFNNDACWAVAVYEKVGYRCPDNQGYTRSYRGIAARIEHQHVLLEKERSGVVSYNGGTTTEP